LFFDAAVRFAPAALDGKGHIISRPSAEIITKRFNSIDFTKLTDGRNLRSTNAGADVFMRISEWKSATHDGGLVFVLA
jgi:hypothetical protein